MKRIVALVCGVLSLSLCFLAAACQGLPTRDAEQWGSLGPRSSQALGELRVLMAAVRFPDVESGIPLERTRKRTVEGLDQYVKEQSYGAAWVKADFRGWVRLPDPLSEYKVSPYNFQVDRKKVRKLVEDTMTALEKEVDFSSYDHILIIPGVTTQPGKGYGMICYCANPGMLTGVRSEPAFVTLKSKGGKEFRGGVFVGTENAHMGMFAHDFFHALGGVHGRKRLVPCLYDFERQSDSSRTPDPGLHAVYLGPWDIMSEHFVKRNEPPPGICSFTKIRLGWISPERTMIVTPGDTVIASLSPLEKSGDTLVVKIPLGGNRYYLIENRQRIGADSVLPDSGLLILKVDPEIQEGSGTVRIMNACPEDPRFSQATFRLEEGKRNLFEDKQNDVAVVPLWSEGDRLGVLVTTPSKSREGLDAALKIQKLTSRFPKPKGGRAELIEKCLTAFRDLDFGTAARLAQRGME